MGPGATYTMFSLDGRNAGATYALNPQQKAQGVPADWALYVAVQDADDTARRAAQLGAQIFMPPFDVDGHGRMTVMADPTGAVFCIWQAKHHQGVGITGVDGTVCWADLNTPQPEQAQEFYRQLFGWHMNLGEKDPSGYVHIVNGETPIGGIPPAEYRDPQIPPHWLLYFQISDCAAAVSKAEALGAGVLMPTQEIPHVGHIAIVKDPQGAVFAFYQAPAKTV